MILLRINMDGVGGQLDLFQPKEWWKLKKKCRNSPRRIQKKGGVDEGEIKEWQDATASKYNTKIRTSSSTSIG